jgi:hypothetical protein
MSIVHPDDGSPFFQLARTVLQQANFALDKHIVEPERILSHYDRVQYLLKTLLRLSNNPHDRIDNDTWINAALQASQNISLLNEWRLLTNTIITSMTMMRQFHNPHPLTIELDQLDTDGRPRFLLPWDTITAYRKSNHSWTQIANILNISRRTLHRHRVLDEYQDPNPYSAITDDELDTIVPLPAMVANLERPPFYEGGV